MQFTVKIPSFKDIGNFVGKVAREGYEGSIRIPSAQEGVDAVCKVADAASRLRVTMKDRQPVVE